MKKQKNRKNYAWYWWYFVYLIIASVVLKAVFKFPEAISELWFKPVLWLVPLFWLNRKDNDRVNVFGGDWQKSIVAGVALGIGYLMVAMVVLGINDWKISGNGLGIAFVAAVCENLAFFGLVLPAMIERMGLSRGVVICGLIYGFVHLPAALGMGASIVGLIGVFLISATIGVMNGMARTASGSALVPILATWMWYGVLIG